MKNSILIIPTILFSVASQATVWCYRTTPLNNASQSVNSVFTCGKGKAKFEAVCDLSEDPIENSNGYLDVKVAQWVVHGPNQGIEGTWGSITCNVISAE